MNIPTLPNTLMFHHTPVEYTTYFLQRMQSAGVDLPVELHHAVLKRKCEYLAARFCVKQGLISLNYGILNCLRTGHLGQPLWPPGVIGSISHCFDHAIAIVSIQTDVYVGLGVDVEKIIAIDLAKAIEQQLVSVSELSLGLSYFEYKYFITLIFSAKESIYKAIFPFVNQILDFSCVKLMGIDKESSKLTFQFSNFFESKFTSYIVVGYSACCTNNLIVTWCCLMKNNLIVNSK